MAGEPGFASTSPRALAATALAWFTRALSLRRKCAAEAEVHHPDGDRHPGGAGGASPWA